MSAAFSLYFYPCGLSGLAAVEQLHEACQGYDNWLRLAFALSDGLGEAGRQIFDRLSQMNADYDTRECNRLYDNCMKGNKGGITIATFFQMARDLANVDLKEMAREREEKSLQKSLNCLNVSLSHKMDNKCNKKDKILIYNNLDNTTNSTGDNETMRQLRQSCKDFF
ncbi:PriCT-2 domain-containing protein [uncultured Prevotella sp.]|uniref:PriCT-2 domain-containing protein n=1 Tax=uncultured Prevotella sp. TaxID=159272 RepID=UPI00266CD883|nr:PriCT-2 domain-containing protein [uncultured Prevotella sp.]